MNVLRLVVASMALLLLPISAYAAATGVPAVIHPGDQIAVVVYGETTLSQTITVQPDGMIDYPLVGPVPVGGCSPQAASQVLAGRLSEYLLHPMVSISISQPAEPTVLVLGAVKTPGKYQLRASGRVTDAIAAAGGLGDTDGAYADARLTYPNGDSQSVSLEDLLRRGQSQLDLSLTDGTVLYVPGPTTFNVNVIGAVDHPGDISVKEGDPVEVAISRAGNSANAQSDLNRVHLTRTVDGKATTTIVNVYHEMQTGTMTALKKGDIITVPQGVERPDFLSSGLWWVLSRLIP